MCKTVRSHDCQTETAAKVSMFISSADAVLSDMGVQKINKWSTSPLLSIHLPKDTLIV